ncbi:Vacuolar protein sorting-associated protein 41 [Serendipita sp. 399]|nr:Vacuolar protein sorting-associated protein 41 [Serendipita sp. 399]
MPTATNQSILPSFSLFPTSSPGTPRSATQSLRPEPRASSPASALPRASSPQPPLIISDTIATASLDGQAILHTLSTATTAGYNFKRPLRTIALEPNYANSPSKSYVSGGMAGELILTSKSHLSMGGLENVLGGLGLGGGGGMQTNKVLHSGEGPIWIVRWKGDVIAWANDFGVRVYSVSKGERIAFVDRPKDSPRADLFQCSLTWRHLSTTDADELIIGWADLIKVIRISTRTKVIPSHPGNRKEGGLGGLGLTGGAGVAPASGGTETVVEVTKVLRLDCMLAGVLPWPFEDGKVRKVAHEGASSQVTGVPTSATAAPIIETIATAPAQRGSDISQPNSFLLLSYIPARTLLSSESTSYKSEQKRQTSTPPELRIVTSDGEERSSDVLAMKGYDRWVCTDYRIIESFPPPHVSSSKLSKGRLRERDHGGWFILSPKGIILARKRDRMDRVSWLVERERYEEALDEMEVMEKEGEYVKSTGPGEEDTHVLTKDEIGRMYLTHLFKEKEYEKAAKLCPKVLRADSKAWEDWIFQFRHVNALKVLVPFVPFKSPRLSKVAYGIILDYYLRHDVPALSQAIKDWPSEIYDVPALINAIPQPPSTVALMECLADLYIRNRQPGKALQYFLRLRRPNVFQLIRENHLFTDVQDQALLLVEFDQELMKQREHLRMNQPPEEPKQASANKVASSVIKKSPAKRAATDSAAVAGGGTGGVFQALFSAALPTSVFGTNTSSNKQSLPTTTPKTTTPSSRPQLASHSHYSSYWTSENANDALPDESYVAARGEAIPLLVEHSHSIPIAKVVSQLESRPDFLFLYLDALFEKDIELCAQYLERQVELYAQFRKGRVIRLLQSAQNLQMALPFEKIYKICEDKNMVPEMVWVRSRMGDNKGALFLIIDRLGDVSRAIDFAKERKDDELWEDLLRYSETRPTFIKALLENVTTEIDPIRIIRRIRNGLEIPGLKESIIKILQDFNLQISLMEGCGNVLESDCEGLARRLHRAQAGGQIGIPNGICLICSKPLLQVTQDLVLVFLCGHMVHAHCTSGGAGLPKQADSSLVGIGLGMERDFGIKLA